MGAAYKFDARCNELYNFLHSGSEDIKISTGLYNWLTYQKREYSNGKLDKYREDRLRGLVANIFDSTVSDAIKSQIKIENMKNMDNALRVYGINGVQDLIRIYSRSLDSDIHSQLVWRKLLYTISQIKNNNRLSDILNNAIKYTKNSIIKTLKNGSILLAESICKDDELVINVAYNIERFWGQLSDYLGEGKISIIYKKYYIGMNYSDIAKQLGVSRALISYKAIQAIKQLSTKSMVEALSGQHIERLPSILFGQTKLNRIMNTKYSDGVHNIIDVVKRRFGLTQESDEYILGKMYLALDFNVKEIDGIIKELREESDELRAGYDSIFNQGKRTPNYVDALKAEQLFILKLSILSSKYNPDIDICTLRLPKSIENKFKSIGINTISQLIQYSNCYTGNIKDEMYQYVEYINRKILKKCIADDSLCKLDISDILYHKLMINGINTVDKLKEAIENGDIYNIKGIGKSKVNILINAISQ